MKNLLTLYFTALAYACAFAEPADMQQALSPQSPASSDHHENQPELAQTQRVTMSAGNEELTQPSRDTLFLISYATPHKIISAPIEMFCPKGPYSYAEVNEKIYSVDMETGSSKQVGYSSSRRDDASLSPLFEAGSVSFVQPFITNELDNAGSCYLMPAEMPETKAYTIQNLPPNVEVEKCAATLQKGKLLLKVRHGSTGKSYYVFFDPATGLLDAQQHEIACGLENSQPTGLLGKGDYIWEVSVNKRKMLEYVVYSISRQTIMQHREISLAEGEVPIVTEKGLFAVHVLTNRVGEIYTTPQQENPSPAAE